MSINLEVDTLDEIFVNIFDGLVDGHYIDIQIRPSVFTYNNMYLSRTCNYKLDLGMVGLTPTRWPRLINDYVDRNKLAAWFPKLKNLNRGREMLFAFNEVKPVQRAKMSNYNYGACLLGITYRAYPPKITLFSRATNWAQIGALDLGLAGSFAWHIADYMGNITRDEIEFAWLNSNTYLMAITTLPFLVSHGRLLEVLRGDFPISRDTKNLMKYFSDVPEPKYAPITRMRKRIAYILDGRSQKVPVDQLRLFTDKEWELVKEGVPEDKDFRKLRGGYEKTVKHEAGPLHLGVTYDLPKEVKKQKLTYKTEAYEYLSGFVNGDGSIYQTTRSRTCISVYQKTPEILEYFKSLTGLGRIQRVKPRSSRFGKGESYFWRVSKKDEVLRLLSRLSSEPSTLSALAGFADAEGCFSRRKSGRLTLTIAQKDKKLLIRLRKRFGNVGQVRPHNQSCSRWVITDYSFLSKLNPHLKLKRQVDLEQDIPKLRRGNKRIKAGSR